VCGFSISKHDPQRRNEAHRLLRQIRDGMFEGGYSDVTLQELLAAPPRVATRLRKKIGWSKLHRIRVRSRSEVHDLAIRYCNARAIPHEYFEDALHVATPTLWRADALVSFNFTHLVRLETMILVNEINRKMEPSELFLCQPSEVILS
jgi:predicted nucleic acid-binding protein